MKIKIKSYTIDFKMKIVSKIIKDFYQIFIRKIFNHKIKNFYFR